MARVTFLESNAELEKRIRKGLAEDINKAIRSRIPQLESQLEPIFRSALRDSPEMNSLSNGLLRAEFGLENDPSNAIVEAVVSSLTVQWVKINPSNFSGGVTISLQPSDFANLLSLPEGKQEIKGGSLPWLSWLLTLGDEIIITGYGVEFGSFPTTRTGEAKMSTKFAPYKVNSAFSGTIDDNFVTRAIDRVAVEVQNVIRRIL